MFDARYTFGIRLAAPMDQVREATAAALKVEGFGILTEIDMAATMRARLDVELEPYVILGACNPALAYRAVTADRSIGALLPCNVVLRADGETTVLEVLDPRAALGLGGMAAIAEIAEDARARLRRALDQVAGQLPLAVG